MKKTVSFLTCALFLTALIAAPAIGQTTKDVLAKFIQAQGGAKALTAVKDTTINGSLEMVQFGMTGTITLFQKEPNKVKVNVEVMGTVITQAYDGTVAWMINPQTGATEQMPDNFAEEMKRQALGNDALLNPEKYGITYEFKGKEKIETKDYLILEQTMSDGHKTTMYLDPETYLTYKAKGTTMSEAGVEVMAESFFGDYKKVGDVMMAHTLTTFREGQEFMRMTFTKVTFNSGLEDSLFQMPK